MPENGGFVRISEKRFVSAFFSVKESQYEICGFEIPCFKRFIAPIRSITSSRSYPVNIVFKKCSRRSLSNKTSLLKCSRTYWDADTRKPAVPQAGSQIISVGCGFIKATIISIICRGVRNCPFSPEESIIDKRYSYKSPKTSPSGCASRYAKISSICDTIRSSFSGVGILNRAFFIYFAYAESESAWSVFRNGNTPRDTTLYIFSAGNCSNTDHLNQLLGIFSSPSIVSPANILENGRFSIRHSASRFVSVTSKSRINIRYVICSIASIGFDTTPDQNVFRNFSTLLCSSPEIIRT